MSVLAAQGALLGWDVGSIYAPCLPTQLPPTVDAPALAGGQTTQPAHEQIQGCW